MSNPFLGGSKHLNQEWRNIRESLSIDKTDEEQLLLVAKFWANAPISSDFLNWDNSDSWPNPWELMMFKTFDNNAIALGIEYTLLLGKDERWNSNRVKLHLINDNTVEHLVVVVDNKYALNYDYAALFSNIDILKSYAIFTYENKKHHEIKP